jgi:hypothetical protein
MTGTPQIFPLQTSISKNTGITIQFVGVNVNNNQLQKLGDGSTDRGTYKREINIHTNIHELHEIPTHPCRRECANRFHKKIGINWFY